MIRKLTLAALALVLVAGLCPASQSADRYAPDARIKQAPAPDHSRYVAPVKRDPKVWHFNESFEGTWPPAGWTVVDVLDPTQTWVRSTNYPHTGSYSAFVYWSSSSAAGEDWLITPQFTVQNNDSCYFWFRAYITGYAPDETWLLLSTTDNQPASFTNQLWYQAEGAGYTTTYAEYAVDLSAFAGQQVYLAFKHADYWGDGVVLDDVRIGHEYTPVPGDLALESIDEPSGSFIEPGLPFTPAATVENPGTTPVTDFQVIYSIDDGVTKALVYQDTVLIASPDSLFPDSVRQVTFDDFTPLDLTNYYVTAYVVATGDPNQANDTLTTYFRTFNELVGNVTDDNNGGAPVDAATITAVGPATYSTTTDGDGDYFFFDMDAGTYTVTASKAGYINEVATGVVITDGAQTTLDMSMGYPVLALSPADSIYVSLPWGMADSTTWQFTLENQGSRDMNYGVSWPALVKGPKALGDTLWNLDVGAICADNQLLGAEYVDGYLWITGGGNGADPNKLYKIDVATGTLSATYDQSSAAGWGWRDLAYDGAYLYASDDATVKQIDPATGLATGVSISGPTNPCRAMAYNPVNDHFYTANFGSSIWEFDRTGTVVNTWANTLSIYGLACDPYNPAGPSLWVWSQDGSPQLTATRFDLTTGAYGTETFVGWSPSGAGIAGGACLSDMIVPGKISLVGLSQDDPNDYVTAYEIRDNSVDWLDITPFSGTVSAYGSQDLAVTFDAAGLDSFTDYAANVTFNTNAQLAKATAYVPAYLHVIGTGVSGGPNQPLSYAFGLNANRPNPVNGRTTFSFTLPKAQDYALKVYNITGQMVQSYTGRGQAGPNRVSWNTGRNGAGVYFYQLASGGLSATRKLVVIR